MSGWRFCAAPRRTAVGLPAVGLPAVGLLAVGLLIVAAAVAPRGAWAGPVPFDLGLQVPPVVHDSKAPPACTVAWLIGNIRTNDFFVARARIAHARDERPVNGRMPCPSIPPQMAARALDSCAARSLDPHHCVYADMARGFQSAPRLHNTAENASRCTSDTANFIGMACWMSGDMAVCNTACGETVAEAEAKAGARCADKQQHACPIRESAPVMMP